MKQAFWLMFLLSVFWLVNSGHFDPLLLGLGLFSVALVMLINHRMTIVNGEYQPPVLLSSRLPSYLLWLLVQIIKSNLEVVRCIWQSRPAISPTLLETKSSQQTDICKVLFANSITMTPGTVTLELKDGSYYVHALTKATAAGLQTGEMDRRIRSLEN